MADGRHIENRFLAISRRRIDQLMRNLDWKYIITCQYRTRDQNCNFRKFKMANGRHFVNSFISISQPWIIRPCHCSKTVFFRDNFVIFRRRSKRVEFLESLNFYMCAYAQIFNFRDGHVTIFRHPSGPICQINVKNVVYLSTSYTGEMTHRKRQK